MHVLIIPSWYPKKSDDINGCFFREQAILLRKNGCKVGVIHQELRSLKNWRSLFSSTPNLNTENDEEVLTYRSWGVNWFPRINVLAIKLFTWYGIRLYKRYVAENGAPDIVHVHSILYAGLIAKKIFKKHKIPFIITEHSSAFSRNLIKNNELLITKKVSSVASRKFAVSKEFAELLNSITGKENRPWEDLPNTVNKKFYTELPQKNKIESRFDFINVAFMNENKRQSNVLQAFANICKQNQNAYLTLGGDGPMRGQLENLTYNLGIKDRVKFLGMLSREQVMTAISSADAFVLSSRHETFGIVLIEALALGKPVIATRCGGPESIVRNKDGILIPVDDISALTAAMKQMIEKYNEYDSNEIRIACKLRYGETVISKKLIQTYAAAISENRSCKQ